MIGLALSAILLASPAEAEALRDTAPAYLTVETAAENLLWARIAGAVTDTDPALLLAIAWHESRYIPTVRTREPGGKARDTGRLVRVRWSCGVMTPTPNERCHPSELVMFGGYLAGARHLREWMSIRHNLLRAVISYAGAGPRAWAFGHQMIARAARIRRALARACAS